MTPVEKFQSRFAVGPSRSNQMIMPIMMTFAARYIGVTYSDYLRDPMLQARAQFEVCTDFGLELLAAISDPVSELAALGGTLIWFDDDSPAPDPLQILLNQPRDLNRLVQPDPNGSNRMGDRIHAIHEMKRLGRDQLPVMGWVEGPISEAAVMRGMTNLMEDLIDDPDFVEELFAFNVEMAIRYAQAQVEAGADIIGFGDAPASLIGPAFYEQLVLPYEQKMIAEIQRMGVPVRMHICGNSTRLLPLMAQSGANVIDIDSVTDFQLASDAIPASISLLGNLDPVREVLNGNPTMIHERLLECQQTAGVRYLFGAGCEIPGRTPHENLRAFAEALVSA